MSAEILRRAAALMRERGEAAVPSPWHHDPEAVMGNVRCAPHPGDDETLMVADTLADRDATHIASWHPAVALAVADWMDNAAEDLAMQDPGGELRKHWDMRVHINGDKALTVARAYLGDLA